MWRGNRGVITLNVFRRSLPQSFVHGMIISQPTKPVTAYCGR